MAQTLIDFLQTPVGILGIFTGAIPILGLAHTVYLALTTRP